ncbi:hypothetical protein E1264_13995 [Actinomadura sp. KC216]|uniref:hypothetical protein n=1 Tax=Actinomadura sp. KC216 TaxID=2530370 RepID=UPI00104BE966|nr:hypothetical protein [Actinomadura sp. KC216]TDB87673.1 hypothetical protein E1264_13995 [Actinomadura sp. KC216]
MTITTTPLPVPSPVPSSGHARRGCGTAGSPVRQHWGTPVAFATLDPAGLLSPSAAEIGPEGPALEALPPGEIITDLEALAACFHRSFDALADAHGPGLAPPLGGVAIDVQVWRHGYDRPAARHAADLVAWWVLDAGPAHAPTGSGAIALADPRTGFPRAAMPGQPWGRHLVVRPTPGAHVAVPGWVASSIVPLERGQHVLVAFASTLR